MLKVLVSTACLALAAAAAPDTFRVTFETDVPGATEPIVVEVTRKLAPLGVDQFHALVTDKFYDAAAFFRVVPNFVVQVMTSS